MKVQIAIDGLDVQDSDFLVKTTVGLQRDRGKQSHKKPHTHTQTHKKGVGGKAEVRSSGA